MSEQAKILAEMQVLVMNIIKTGSASVEDGNRIDELEDLLQEQKCYEEVNHDQYSYLGEEIAGLFISDKYAQAIDKLHTSEIIPNDFFDFVEYHYDEEPLTDMFTDAFIADVNESYASK